MCMASHWFSIKIDISPKGEWMFFNRIIYHFTSHEFSCQLSGLKFARPQRGETRRRKSKFTFRFSCPPFFDRLFWMLVVFVFTFFVVQISHGQWLRYQRHPTIISLETNYGDWMYRYPAVTMCSNYTDAQTTNDVVQRYDDGKRIKKKCVSTKCICRSSLHVSDSPRELWKIDKMHPRRVHTLHSLWNISGDDDAFAVRKAFAETVATTTWSNLHNFARFANDSEHLKGVDVRQLAFMVSRGKKFPLLIFPLFTGIDSALHETIAFWFGVH